MAATEATGKFVGDILRHGFPKRQLMAFFVTRALMQNNKNMRSIYSLTQPRSVDRRSSIPFRSIGFHFDRSVASSGSIDPVTSTGGARTIGLCKSRSERFNNNTAGKYEYVDVRCGGDYNRYIVETNLAEEFEIARPTKRYTSIISQVPRVFVGTPEDLKKLVKIMCHEMRRSMKQVGIHVPPWRRKGYMQAKWFSFY
ncbi:hypothetical protein Bca101_037145 [Brassica carinata]